MGEIFQTAVELPTKNEIIQAAINGCQGLPGWVMDLNIEEALKEYEELLRLIKCNT